MADNEKPARNSYGESSREAVNASGYRYPESHFIPPKPIQDAVGGEEGVSEALLEESDDAPKAATTKRSTKNRGGPRANK